MPESFGDFFAQCEALVDRYGQGVIAVPDGEPVPFAYTYGRARAGKPDLLIVAPLPFDVYKQLLNNAGVGEDVTEPGDYDGILQGYKVRAVRCNAEGRDLMTVARWVAPELDALQLLMPDKMMVFPDEDGYDWQPQPVYAELP